MDKTRRLAGLLLAAFLGISLGALLAAASMIIPLNPSPALPTPGDIADVAPAAISTTVTAVPTPVLASAATPEVTAAAVDQPAEKVSRRLTVLVMGVDNRPDEPVGRTDTIMLLTIDPDTRSAGVVSLARDLLVPIPGKAQNAKINMAHMYGETEKYPGGGPALLGQTVANFLGYPVDYWVRINFDGFRQIIDQLGGIDIDVPEAINDPLYPDNNYGYDPLYIPAGHIHMDGTLALKYARTRHIDSDYGRARRQQQVVLAVKDKLMQPGRLTALLPRLPGLAITLAKSVQTNMPIDKAIAFARQLNQADLQNPASAVIDDKMGVNSTDPVWGFVLIPDMTKVRTAAARVFGQQTLAQTGKATPAAIAEEPQPRIAVLNGTPQTDLADRIAASLSGNGYLVVGIGEADNQNYSSSWLIRYTGTSSSASADLARTFAIPADHIRTETGSGDVDVALILGADAIQSALSAPPVLAAH